MEETKQLLRTWMQQESKRIDTIDAKLDVVETNTRDVVTAFNAAQGAFKVLEWLGKLAKPLMWIGGAIGVASMMHSHLLATPFVKSILEIFKKG